MSDPIIKIFYSWQSDLPNFANRGFISNALESVAKDLRRDKSVKVEPVIDRDTSGVPGAPDISATILRKIDTSDIFVADVSLVSSTMKKKSAPNPNVLFELGYAAEALGEGRLVLVVNTAFGGPENLPFDLKMKRAITYNLDDSNKSDKANVRKELQGKIRSGILEICKKIEDSTQNQQEFVAPFNEALSAIDKSRPDVSRKVKEFMTEFVVECVKLSPKWSDDKEKDEELVECFQKTPSLVGKFVTLAMKAASMNSELGSKALYVGLEPILERYKFPANQSGSYFPTDFDYFKLLGHELMTVLFACLIEEERWSIVSTLIDIDLHVSNARGEEGEAVQFLYASKPVELLKSRNERLKVNRKSIHADLLNDRYTMSPLREMISIESFISADYFLFLVGELMDGLWFNWIPWSTLYLQRPPRFLISMKRKKYAEKRLPCFGVDDVEHLRGIIKEKSPLLKDMHKPFWDYPFNNFDFDKLGTL